MSASIIAVKLLSELERFSDIDFIQMKEYSSYINYSYHQEQIKSFVHDKLLPNLDDHRQTDAKELESHLALTLLSLLLEIYRDAPNAIWKSLECRQIFPFFYLSSATFYLNVEELEELWCVLIKRTVITNCYNAFLPVFNGILRQQQAKGPDCSKPTDEDLNFLIANYINCNQSQHSNCKKRVVFFSSIALLFSVTTALLLFYFTPFRFKRGP